MQPYITTDLLKRSVAFTGYRPQKLPFLNDLDHPDTMWLRANLKTEFDNYIKAGFRRFVTGGALGCDLLAAEVILELIDEYAGSVKLMHQLCLPCYDHEIKWKEEDKRRLHIIMGKSNCSYISERPYFNGCMQVRNRFMVDTCQALLAVYDGQSGGTHNTVEYARSKNRQVVIINPKQFMRIKLIETPEDIQLMLDS